MDGTMETIDGVETGNTVAPNYAPANPAQGVSEDAKYFIGGDGKPLDIGAGDVLAIHDNLPETVQEAYALGWNECRKLTAAIGAGGQAVAERCAAIADDLSKDALFLDDKGRYGAELTAAAIRVEFNLDDEPSRSRVTKVDGGYLHQWIDADGEQHSYVHPTNLTHPAASPAKEGRS